MKDLECTCLPLPEPHAENCPVHGEDALCTCGHPVHRHDEVEIGSDSKQRHVQEWCADCSCIDLEYEREPSRGLEDCTDCTDEVFCEHHQAEEDQKTASMWAAFIRDHGPLPTQPNPEAGG